MYEWCIEPPHLSCLLTAQAHHSLYAEVDQCNHIAPYCKPSHQAHLIAEHLFTAPAHHVGAAQHTPATHCKTYKISCCTHTLTCLASSLSASSLPRRTTSGRYTRPLTSRNVPLQWQQQQQHCQPTMQHIWCLNYMLLACTVDCLRNNVRAPARPLACPHAHTNSE